MYVVALGDYVDYNTIINELVPQLPLGTRIATPNDIKSQNAAGKLTDVSSLQGVIDYNGTPAEILGLREFLSDENQVSIIDDYTIPNFSTLYLYGLKPTNKTPDVTSVDAILGIYRIYSENIIISNSSFPIQIYYNNTNNYSNTISRIGSSSSSAARIGSSSSSAARIGSSSSSAARIGSSSSSAARIGSSSSSGAPIGSSSSSAARIGSSSSSGAPIGSSSSSAARIGSSSSSSWSPFGSSSSSLWSPFGSSSSSMAAIGSSSSSAARIGSSSSSAAPFGSSSSSMAAIGSSSSSAARIGSSSSSAARIGSSSSSAARIGSSSSSAAPIIRRGIYNKSNPNYNELYIVIIDGPSVNTPINVYIDYILAYYPIGTRIATQADANSENNKGILTQTTATPLVGHDGNNFKLFNNLNDFMNNNPSATQVPDGKKFNIILYGPKPLATVYSSTGATGSFGQDVTYNGITFRNFVLVNRPRVTSTSGSITSLVEKEYYSSLELPSSIGSSSSSRARIGSSSSSPMFGLFGSSSSSAALFGGLPGMGTIDAEYVSPRGSSSSYYSPVIGTQQAPAPAPAPAPAATTLPPQIYPVAFTSGASITQATIPTILTALNARLATLEDVYVALGFGLNWCYPTYVQKSSTDTSIMIYAASQPGKCGPSSGRQMIKVQPQDNSQPQFVFVFGRKPADETTIMTTAGEIAAGNFYEPITGTSGFRNRYDASKLYESFFATTTCYNALDCSVPAVQTLAQETTAGTTTIDPPAQVTVPTLLASSTTPQGSSSDGQSTVSAQPTVVLISSTTTTAPIPSSEIVVPSQTTLANLQTAYVAPNVQGSSSSYIPTSQVVSDATSTQTSGQTAAKASTKASPSTTTTQTTAAPATQGKTVTQVKYVAKPGAACKEKAEPAFYDPKAGFFSNLFGEFVHDLGRIVKGVQVATS